MKKIKFLSTLLYAVYVAMLLYMAFREEITPVSVIFVLSCLITMTDYCFGCYRKFKKGEYDVDTAYEGMERKTKSLVMLFIFFPSILGDVIPFFNWMFVGMSATVISCETISFLDKIIDNLWVKQAHSFIHRYITPYM